MNSNEDGIETMKSRIHAYTCTQMHTHYTYAHTYTHTHTHLYTSIQLMSHNFITLFFPSPLPLLPFLPPLPHSLPPSLPTQEYVYPDARDRQYLKFFHRASKRHKFNIDKYVFHSLAPSYSYMYYAVELDPSFVALVVKMMAQV